MLSSSVPLACAAVVPKAVRAKRAMMLFLRIFIKMIIRKGKRRTGRHAALAIGGFYLLVDEFTSKRVDETSFSCKI